MAIIYGLFDPRSPLMLYNCRYIGQTIQSSTERRGQHITDSRSGKQRYVHKWIRKMESDGVSPVIVIIDRFDDNDYDAIDGAERFWIAKGRGDGWRLTNHNDGGRGNRGYKHTEETKAKISEAHTGRKLPTRSEEWRRKQSEAHAGKKRSPESIAKAAESNRGRKRSPETRKAISDGNMGRTVSDETRQKISDSKSGVPNPKLADALRGRPLSEDHKQKIRESVLANLPQGEARERVLEAARTKPSEETKAKMSDARKAWWANKREDESKSTES